MATKWGVAGCGLISSDFLNSWKSIPENHTLVACAARSLDRAKEFAKKFNGKKAYGSYEELAKDPEVEIVYIGTVTTTHFELVKLYLNAGKNVLCEKPLGLTLSQTQAMVDLARKKGIFLMEALWSRCLPVYEQLEKVLDSGKLGTIKDFQANFGFTLPKEKLSKNSIGGGVTLHFGIYSLQAMLLAFNEEMPSEIKSIASLNEEGLDEDVALSMKFSSGRIASFHITSRSKLANDASIGGTKGSIVIKENFWAAEEFTSDELGNFTSKHPVLEGIKTNFPGSSGLVFEAEEARNCLKNGQLESKKVPLELTLKLAKLMQDIMEQIGYNF